MNRPLIATTIAALAMLAGCANQAGSMTGATATAGAIATATLGPTMGNLVYGSARFTQSGGKVLVKGEIRNLKPNGEYGFHVHETGDCSGGDGMRTGGHFNPEGKAHGQHGQGMHHAGDLQSLKSDGNGVASFEFESSTMSVGAGATDIIGRGLIVHRDPDDYKTQPTGNAGPRLACAVIVKY